MLLVRNLDWLAFSIKLIPTPEERTSGTFSMKCPQGYKLFSLNGTNIYKNRAILYNKGGQKVLTLLWHPHSKMLPFDTCLVEVANEFLYSSLVWLYETLGKCHQYVFSNLSRVDICCDFSPDQRQAKIIDDLANNKCYVAGKREGSMFHTFSQDSPKVGRIAHCISWGSKRSNIKWKLYNKTKEIFIFDDGGNRYCTKPYIVEAWERVGIDKENAWRLEVSINPASKFEMFGEVLHLRHLINKAFFVDELFDAMYTNRFVIRKNEGKKDKSNNTRVHLLDIDKMPRVTQREPTHTLEVAEYVSGLLSAMKERAKAEVQANDQVLTLWTNTAVSICRLGHLEEYFLKTFGKPIEDIATIDLLPTIEITTAEKSDPIQANENFESLDYESYRSAFVQEPPKPNEEEDDQEEYWWDR